MKKAQKAPSNSSSVESHDSKPLADFQFAASQSYSLHIQPHQ